LGGLDALPRIARARGAEEIIVLADLSAAQRRLLLATAADLKLAVREWIPRLQPLREADTPTDPQPPGSV